jgi:hypothetical protein
MPNGARARWPAKAAYSDHCQPHLAGLCLSAASGRGLQAFQRPAVRRKSPRHVGLYLNPPDKALVLCVDEKAQIQTLDRSQRLLPKRPGQAERRTADYVRHGATNLFAALDAKAGTVIGEFHRRHRTGEFRSFLETIDATVPRELELQFASARSATFGNWWGRLTPTWLITTPTSGPSSGTGTTDSIFDKLQLICKLIKGTQH